MSVLIPGYDPDIALALPETDGLYGTLELTNGQQFAASGTVQFEVKTDINGRYITPPVGVQDLNLGLVGDFPDQDIGAESVVMRLRCRLETPTWPDAPPMYVSGSLVAVALNGLPGLSVDAQREGLGGAEYAVQVGDDFMPGAGAYQELRVYVAVGEPVRALAFNVTEGEEEQLLYESAEPFGDIAIPVLVNQFTIATNPENITPRPEMARLYGFDVWVNPTFGSGQWLTRQRQTLSGNAGGWPLRQRGNGGFGGSWPLRQRQSGL